MTCGARRCSGSLAGAAVELRPEESRRALEDLVGPPELLVLPFELAHPDPFLGRETGASAPVDLGLLDPVAEGLGADPELAGDAGDDALVVAVPLDGLLDHPDRAFLDLSWIATRAWVSVGVGHGLHLPSKRWSLHQSQGGSLPARSQPWALTHSDVTFNLTMPSWTSATADGGRYSVDDRKPRDTVRRTSPELTTVPSDVSSLSSTSQPRSMSANRNVRRGEPSRPPTIGERVDARHLRSGPYDIGVTRARKLDGAAA